MSAEPIDFAAEGLLDGLEGSQRTERIALLAQLAADGVPLSELRRSTDAGTIMYLPADRVIVSSERYTAAEIAELSGIEEDFLIAARRAMGLPLPEPDEAVYTEAELESARTTHVARAAGLSDEELLDLMRVLGRSLSQVAETLRAMPLKLVLEPGMSEPELANRYAQAAGALYPLVNPLLESVLTLHLKHATQSTVVSELERSGGILPGSREAVRLEALAGDAVEAPVRLVKTIGDAAMLASPEPEPLLAAALRLIDAAETEGEDFPQLRAGAAIGQALPRAGDWFGRPVNLASRITAVARPSSLLVERELRESVDGPYRWSFAGERRL
jgi:adenylate cyclase